MMRMLASIVTWALIAGQVMQPVYAVLTPLGDVPVAAKVAAKPNIVYTLDDSGSMQNNYLPDFATSAGATVNIGTITRPAASLIATATGLGANTIAAGDFITIAGATPPEFDGYFQVLTKPTGTSLTYKMLAVPATSPAGIAAGYAGKIIVTSAAYCRGGNATTPCVAQAMNLSPSGSAVSIASITRSPVFPAAGPATATATGTAVNFQNLSTGDTVTIAGATGTSGPFNVVNAIITVTSATTFTYQIAAIATTPTTAAGTKT